MGVTFNERAGWEAAGAGNAPGADDGGGGGCWKQFYLTRAW